MQNSNLDGLSTLEEGGQVPETRLSNSAQARSLVEIMVQADGAERAWKRSRVANQMGGGIPFDKAEQRRKGLASKTNINFRMGEAYLESALTAFYDIFSEVPSYAICRDCEYGSSDQSEEWGSIATEEFHKLQLAEENFDYDMALSQQEMVLYGQGPLIFNDEWDFRCQSVRTGNLLVPEHAKSTNSRWELAVLLQDLLPHELYSFIRLPERAAAMGWNVPVTRNAIMNAHPESQKSGISRTWEWHQQQLKNSSFYYSQASSKTVSMAHAWYKEFPTGDEPDGKISHKIILRDVIKLESAETGEKMKEDFLFKKIGRFENWQQCVHPMYYDHGHGGEHHSVTGMGIKLWKLIDLQNRLLCNSADKALSPKMLFKATTASNRQKMAITHFGDYGVIPENFDFVQAQVAGFMTDSMMFNRELSNITSNNMSQYRQMLQQKSGNPITKAENDSRMSEMSKLGKSQLNRYFDQLDYLYAEKFRRASNSELTIAHPGGREALNFQKRCKERGVPMEVLRKMEVKAYRNVGAGSLYERKQSLEFMLGLMAMLPESGRESVLRMSVSTWLGQHAVDHVYPKAEAGKKADQQEVIAMLQVASMKDAIAPVVSSDQNPAIFSQIFIKAASEALASLQQGADPHEVLVFLELAGPAAASHISRMEADPSRKALVAQSTAQLKKIAQATDQLKGVIQKQMQMQQERQQQIAQAQQQAQAIQNGSDPDTMIRTAETQHKLRLDEIKTQSGLRHKDEKAQQSAVAARQKMALADLETAAKLRREAAVSRHNGESD